MSARASFERAVSGVLTEVDRQRLSVPAGESWPAVRSVLAGARQIGAKIAPEVLERADQMIE